VSKRLIKEFDESVGTALAHKTLQYTIDNGQECSCPVATATKSQAIKKRLDSRFFIA
jgi:hypothetical protein